MKILASFALIILAVDLPLLFAEREPQGAHHVWPTGVNRVAKPPRLAMMFLKLSP